MKSVTEWKRWSLGGFSASIDPEPELFSPGMWWIGLMVKRSGSEVQTLQMNS